MKEEGDTQDEQERVIVLCENNPGVRRVGSDRMAAMEALAGQRRRDVSTESGVDIPDPPPVKKDGAADPDADHDDDSYVDPTQQRQEPDPDAEATAKAEAAKRAEEAKR